MKKIYLNLILSIYYRKIFYKEYLKILKPMIAPFNRSITIDQYYFISKLTNEETYYYFKKERILESLAK